MAYILMQNESVFFREHFIWFTTCFKGAHHSHDFRIVHLKVEGVLTFSDHHDSRRRDFQVNMAWKGEKLVFYVANLIRNSFNFSRLLHKSLPRYNQELHAEQN